MSRYETAQEALNALNTASGDALTEAIETLAEHQHAPAVPRLVGMLDDEMLDPGTRFIVVRALGRLGDEAALTVLLDELRGDDIWVRAAATGALISIGSPAVSGLVQALSDEDKAVRRAAAKALGKIGERGQDQEVLRGLSVGLLDVDGAVRRFAAEALGRLEAASMVPELSEALNDRNTSVRIAAFRALAKIDTPEAQSAVRQWVKQ
jgi:HEAT repeat protein